ncbi:MAG: hypothetical protein QXE92_00245 [Thermofilaceae archaeon]
MLGLPPASCPDCGYEVHLPLKRWMLKPKNRSGRALMVEMYECPNPDCPHLHEKGVRRRWRIVEKAASL